MPKKKRKQDPKWAQPKRRKMTVLLSPALHGDLEALCERMGVSKNSAAIIGIAYVCALLAKRGATMSLAEVQKWLQQHLDDAFPG